MFRIDADDEPGRLEGPSRLAERRSRHVRHRCADPPVVARAALARSPAAIVITMTLTAGSASATVVERERVFKNPYEFTAWDCGYPMQVVGVETHMIHVRANRRLEDNFLFTNNYAWRETWTAADGRSFTISGNGIFKDVKAQSLGGSLYRFEFHENGQPIVDHQLGRQGHLPRPRELHRKLHVRLRDRRVQLPRRRAPRTTPDVRCRSVPARRTAHGDQ